MCLYCIDEIQANVLNIVTDFLTLFCEMDKTFTAEGKTVFYTVAVAKQSSGVCENALLHAQVFMFW